MCRLANLLCSFVIQHEFRKWRISIDFLQCYRYGRDRDVRLEQCGGMRWHVNKLLMHNFVRSRCLRAIRVLTHT